ncbi:MAG: AAA family ATPase [Desulfovibrionaceae bacterium]|nr:AAA family ATPase [Desulfovibrionaceae bacterium]
MQRLPIGLSNFGMIRRKKYVYVDKTKKLLQLIDSGCRYFLSRPRRFGKSLMISTLQSMFRGEAEQFRGLAAEEWVSEQKSNPCPVLVFDMSIVDIKKLETYLIAKIDKAADSFSLKLKYDTFDLRLENLLGQVYKKYGEIVVLIDEYDKAILDAIPDVELAKKVREILRSFYIVFKSCDEYLNFILITGISKFSKTGVFSVMNNLEDISFDEDYGNILGYSQDELEKYFSEYIVDNAKKYNMDKCLFIEKLRDYYDGFCFDGRHSVYNPFSIMQCLKKGEFSDYWYDSGSSNFIVKYMKQNNIDDPKEYENFSVPKEFTSSQEIENARPENFLYQAGYLTIKKKEENDFILSYPNYEVRHSIDAMYLEHVYTIRQYHTLGSELWHALARGDIACAVSVFNAGLASVPYDDFPNRDEHWYRSLFLMLLRGSGIAALGEVHTNKGRPDIVLIFSKRVIVLEFKCAQSVDEIPRIKSLAEKQINDKNYAKTYERDSRCLTQAVFIINLQEKEIVLG